MNDSSDGAVGAEAVTTAAPERKPRGFAALDPEKLRELSTKGGRTAHERGRAHQFTTEEAKAAGRKGGHARQRARE